MSPTTKQIQLEIRRLFGSCARGRLDRGRYEIVYTCSPYDGTKHPVVGGGFESVLARGDDWKECLAAAHLEWLERSKSWPLGAAESVDAELGR